MRNFFYPQLAGKNIWKNRRIYVPYILTCIFNIAMFYMMFYMFANPDLDQVRGGEILRIILLLGIIVIGIFSLIFLCYSNSFLIKRRKKEFGLYNVLGMEKRHIRRTLFWEMLYVIGISFFSGLFLGILGSKVMFLVLLKLLHVPAPFGFIISIESLTGTCIWFLCIFLLTLALDMWQIQLANPIELLRGGSTGEREPKAKALLVLVGLLCLGGGYYIAVATENPLEALLWFFVAVVLVMIGTYCLFTAGSIAVLKALRWNKRFYYQTRHFTSISGLLYRMKQNAVGLANICILSTGVLIMVSGTISMYAGMEDIMSTRYPHEAQYTLWGEEQREWNDALAKLVQETAKEKEMEVTYLEKYSSLNFTAFGEGASLQMKSYDPASNTPLTDFVIVTALPLEDYNRIMGEEKTLEADEILFYPMKGPKHAFEQLSIGGKEFRIKEELAQGPYDGEATAYVGNVYYMVVRDMEVLKELWKLQSDVYGEAASQISSVLQMDVKGSDKEKESLDYTLQDTMPKWVEQKQKEGASIRYDQEYKQLKYQESYTLYGGLFFLGIFLGILFLMGTTLIIYYKQVSEGYDDRERFEIMQKVGMSKKEVRQSIKSQVLLVFFLPLVTAWVHIAFAFPMITRLLSTLQMYNVKLFGLCTAIFAVLFALVYAAIYGITARIYYKIVD